MGGVHLREPLVANVAKLLDEPDGATAVVFQRLVFELPPGKRPLNLRIIFPALHTVDVLTSRAPIALSRFHRSVVPHCQFGHTIDTQRNINTNRQLQEILLSNFIRIIAIGFIAGLIVRFVSPGPNGASGFILTTVLGIAGAFVATFIGQTIGRYQLDQGAGLIGANVGAVIIVLIIWNRLVVHHLSAIRARDRRAAGL